MHGIAIRGGVEVSRTDGRAIRGKGIVAAVRAWKGVADPAVASFNSSVFCWSFLNVFQVADTGVPVAQKLFFVRFCASFAASSLVSPAIEQA